MTISPFRGLRNEHMALCKCDGCSAEESVRAKHTMEARFQRGGRPKHEIASIGQVHEKLQTLGWGIVKGKHFCPRCEADRKPTPVLQLPSPTKEIPAMVRAPSNVVAPIRQPTKAQEVDIIVMLSAVYDRDARRYQGQETDRTVAEAIGPGIMPGWVAAIREDKFGPAGNEEVTLIRESIAKMSAEHSARIDAIRADLEKAVAQMVKRLDACVAAHDRRVG
jgi:hypothetical protein